MRNPKKPSSGKNPEQVMRANVRKMLSKLKFNVASAEDLWLDFFEAAMPLMFQEYDFGATAVTAKIRVNSAADIANWMLDAYEARWGKVAHGAEGE